MSVSRTFTLLPIDRSRQPFQFGEISERLFATVSAHFRKRCKRSADGWTIRRIKNSALEFIIQIYTGDSCRFSLRHSRDRRGNRRCNTARPAIRATGKNGFIFLHIPSPLRNAAWQKRVRCRISDIVQTPRLFPEFQKQNTLPLSTV